MAKLAVLLLLGVILLLVSWWMRRSSGVPAGAITYSDTDAPAQPLFSQRYGLVGKPDYIVVHKEQTIPVEVKPNCTASQPYESDRLQMAAYCLLIEERDAKAPSFGVLKYRDCSFRIDYTDDLRDQLISVLHEMQEALSTDEVQRSHRSAARCAACGFRRSCEESLDRGEQSG